MRNVEGPDRYEFDCNSDRCRTNLFRAASPENSQGTRENREIPTSLRDTDMQTRNADASGRPLVATRRRQNANETEYGTKAYYRTNSALYPKAGSVRLREDVLEGTLEIIISMEYELYFAQPCVKLSD